MSHHEILAAISNGISVILCEHSNTERGFLKSFQEKMKNLLENKINLEISSQDMDPLIIV